MKNSYSLKNNSFTKAARQDWIKAFRWLRDHKGILSVDLKHGPWNFRVNKDASVYLITKDGNWYCGQVRN